MIDVAAALEIVLAHARPRRPEITALTSSALGSVLAADLTADLDSPPFDKALMDGFAVRARDLPGGTGELHLVGETAAGGAAHTLSEQQTVAVATGAALPAGADAVVKQELATLTGDRVRLADPTLAPGRNVMHRGEEMRAGEVVLPAGTRISPIVFGLCAAIGKTAVPTIPPARVAVIVTGDELVEANMTPHGAQIRNTNGPMLVALTVRAGALPRYLGICRDDETLLTSLVREGLETADVVLLTGGVSVGKRDFTPAVLAALGVEVQVQSVRMKPGKPLLFGTAPPRKPDHPPRLVFGLPGNPVSALVGFELFVRPALKVLAGLPDPAPPRARLTLTAGLAAHHDRPTFHPARQVGADPVAVEPLKWSGSANLRAILGADALIELPPGPVQLTAGDSVNVVLL